MRLRSKGLKIMIPSDHFPLSFDWLFSLDLYVSHGSKITGRIRSTTATCTQQGVPRRNPLNLEMQTYKSLVNLSRLLADQTFFIINAECLHSYQPMQQRFVGKKNPKKMVLSQEERDGHLFMCPMGKSF